MALPSIKGLLASARDAENIALETRQLHRRRKLPSRQVDVCSAIARVNRTQARLRSVIHASNFREVPRADEVREFSNRLQRERRKLRKLVSCDA